MIDDFERSKSAKRTHNFPHLEHGPCCRQRACAVCGTLLLPTTHPPLPLTHPPSPCPSGLLRTLGVACIGFLLGRNVHILRSVSCCLQRSLLARHAGDGLSPAPAPLPLGSSLKTSPATPLPSLLCRQRCRLPQTRVPIAALTLLTACSPALPPQPLRASSERACGLPARL